MKKPGLWLCPQEAATCWPMISHLGGTEGRGASVWNFLSQQCHLQKRPGSKQGWRGLSSSDTSSDRFCRGLVRKEVIAGVQIACASEAGLSLEGRPVFPPRGPKARAETPTEKCRLRHLLEPPVVLEWQINRKVELVLVGCCQWKGLYKCLEE